MSLTASIARSAQPSPAQARARRLTLGAAGVVALFAMWWLGTDVLAAPGSFARRFSFLNTMDAFFSLAASPTSALHILTSLQRIFVGLGLAILIGVPLGIAVGLSPTLEAATTPVFQFLRMVSPLSWMPVAVMVFGVGDKPIYFLLTFAAVWPIVLNTAAGVRQLDRRWMMLASSLAATRWETIRRVVAPGVVGHVLTGVRLAIGICWIVLVPCEMLGVSAGLGYFILDTRDRLAYSELMATVLAVGILGFMLDGAARMLHRMWTHQAN